MLLYTCTPILVDEEFNLLRGKTRLRDAMQQNYTHIKILRYKHGIGTVEVVEISKIQVPEGFYADSRSN